MLARYFAPLKDGCGRDSQPSTLRGRFPRRPLLAINGFIPSSNLWMLEDFSNEMWEVNAIAPSKTAFGELEASLHKTTSGPE
jgi:hypothetical protein